MTFKTRYVVGMFGGRGPFFPRSEGDRQADRQTEVGEEWEEIDRARGEVE